MEYVLLFIHIYNKIEFVSAYDNSSNTGKIIWYFIIIISYFIIINFN